MAKPQTEHTAIAHLLARWSSVHPAERPLWLVNEIDALSAAFNHTSVQQSAKVNRQAVGRKPDDRRKKIRKLLLSGQTSAKIAEATEASAGLIQDVRAELRAEGKYPIKKTGGSKEDI